MSRAYGQRSALCILFRGAGTERRVSHLQGFTGGTPTALRDGLYKKGQKRNLGTLKIHPENHTFFFSSGFQQARIWMSFSQVQ